MSTKGLLALADGYAFLGKLFNEPREPIVGELVFSTAMMGYVEILSDPSFYNQIIVLANAEIGNYGVSRRDFQSNSIKAKALIVRNFTTHSESMRSDCSLNDWLAEANIPILVGTDTRALINHLREAGVMMAALAANSHSALDLFTLAKSAPNMQGQRLSPMVSISKPQSFYDEHGENSTESTMRIVVVDFGVKREILHYLSSHHAEVILVPGASSPEEISSHRPDGILLSNGPGDPSTEVQAVATVTALLGKMPIFGICLGHQILAQALGLSTYKLKCGHRGSNQPVLNSDGKICITAQNHGFAVDHTMKEKAYLSDVSLIDGSNEGIQAPELMAFSLQYHPEGAPGPKDAVPYFKQFADMVMNFKINGGRV